MIGNSCGKTNVVHGCEGGPLTLVMEAAKPVCEHKRLLGDSSSLSCCDATEPPSRLAITPRLHPGHVSTATMPKFFCDYCDVYLTHDSMSVRKAHNNGRNHLRNVQAYYEQISSDQTQQVINSITDAYNLEGQANPLYQANLSGGFPGGPMAGMHGMGGPPMGMGMPGGMPGFPPPGMLMKM